MATITITTTAQQDARAAPAFGQLLGLPGNANTAQVKSWLADQMRKVVHTYEYQQDVQELPPPDPFDPV